MSKRKARVPSTLGRVPDRIAGRDVRLVPFDPASRDLFVVADCDCDELDESYVSGFYVRADVDGTTSAFMALDSCPHVVEAASTIRELVDVIGRYRLAGEPWPLVLSHGYVTWQVAPEHWCASPPS